MTAVRRIERSYGPAEGAASSAGGVNLRDASRLIRSALRDARLAPAGAPLEALSRADEPPRLEGATPLEDPVVVARQPVGDPIVGVAAFLDGIQRSRVIAHLAHVPLVHGAVAAAVRLRAARRLRRWGEPVVSQAVYAPLEAIRAEHEAHRAALEALGAHCDLRDTSAAPRSHPQEYTARALSAVQRTREGAEAALAERWVATGDGVLLVDGGVRGLRGTATSDRVVGVVKSHRTLYAPGESLPVVLGLREGERTSALLLESPNRVPVATWYLRLRGDGASAPLFGLVRVEVAMTDADVTARADLVSRWILAERAPVSLPDQRWDVMVYGIRECEQYLTAILH